jgi:HD superfamily phosphohydrolase
MEIRDRLYGLIEYSELEEEVLNTQILQRLRRVKQLALAELVYPSAGHSRFEHVVGVMHLAGRMATSLKVDGEIAKIIRLAALLHDVGHPPFSHTSELVLQKFTPKSLVEGLDVEAIHEAITLNILEFDEELNHCLKAHQIEQIAALIKPGPRSILKEIVSGPLDADKLDYIHRDAIQAGVSYGAFDLEKVLNCLTPIKDGSEEYVGVLEEGTWAIEQLLLAKYHMHAQVYHHKIRRITDAMLVRGLTLAVQEEIPELLRLFSYVNTKEYCKFFLTFDDEKLMRLVIENSSGSAKAIFERLYERHLFKEIFRVKINLENFKDVLNLRRLDKLNEDGTMNIEREIAKRIGISPDCVVLDKQSLTNPTFKFPKREINPETILVTMQDKTRLPFSDVSSVFANPSVSPRDEFLYVYAPIDSCSRSERNKKISDLSQPIREIIDRHLS